ncbi:MAG: hypothetical protein LBS51_00285 [Oscillospiraceae bacterium]|jgi:hypothetical protein|nr:hypothetical protein [Oscillospiraceae bacterium]
MKSRSIERAKAMLPPLTVITLSYYIFLSLLLLIGEIGVGIIILFVVIPLICLAFSIAYGINNSINIFYVILAAVLFSPSMLIIAITPMWIFVIGYGIVALIGNAIGMIYYNRNVRIKSMTKVGRYLLIAVLGSYVVAVIISAVMMAQMKQITYNSTAYGVTIKEVKIDFLSSTAIRNYYDFYGEQSEHKENAISNAKIMQIKTVCTISLLPIWQRDYHNPWVMDGDQYNIVCGYKNGERSFYGSNAYPLPYWLVYGVIHNAIE